MRYDATHVEGGMMRGVYLIHFNEPYRHARHYIGYADNIQGRIKAHRAGRGARLMEVVTMAGITWELVMTWPGANRTFERMLKRRHGAARFCPVCKAEVHHVTNDAG